MHTFIIVHYIEHLKRPYGCVHFEAIKGNIILNIIVNNSYKDVEAIFLRDFIRFTIQAY